MLLCPTADTPAGQQLLERSEELQDDFQCFVNGLQQAAAADAAGGTSSSMQQRRLLQHIQDQPQQAFRMFCWAQAVVQQAALPVQPAPSAGSRNQHTGKQQQVVLVPGLEHVPKVGMDVSLNSIAGSEVKCRQSHQIGLAAASMSLSAYSRDGRVGEGWGRRASTSLIQGALFHNQLATCYLLTESCVCAPRLLVAYVWLLSVCLPV